MRWVCCGGFLVVSETENFMAKYVFPPMDEKVLSNGLRLVLIPDRTQEGTVAAMQFPFGRFCDREGFEGTAEMVMGMMQKGTQSLASEAFSEKFEFRGAMLSGNAGEEHSVFELRTLSSFLPELFPVFWEMMFKPSFDKKEFGRYKREFLTALQAEAVDPSFLANRHFYTELAGKQHPSGRFHSIHSIKRITLEHLKAFHGRCCTLSGAVLVVAGNFDSGEFMEKFGSLVQSGEATAEPRTERAEAFSIGESTLRIVDKPDLTQTTILMGHPVPGEDSEERDAIAVANYIFGAGNFSSRLMNRIRSRHGRTYGISSTIASERHFGAFLISTSTQNQTVGEVFSTILDEYEKFCREGVTEAELDKAKRFAVGNIAFQLEGITNVVEKLLWLRFYGHENSYIEQFDRRVDALTVETVNRAVDRHFSAEKLIGVMVGRKADLMPQLDRFKMKLRTYHYRDGV